MNLNLIQKIVISSSICLVILMIFLQNPLSGYSVERDTRFDAAKPCDIDEKREMREAYIAVEKISPGGNTLLQIEEKVSKCMSTYVRTEYLPFDQWRSNLPLVYWLGSVLNLLFSTCTVAVMAGVVFLVFRKPAPNA